MAKKTLATVWLQGCSGCHIAFLDLDFDLLEVLNHYELIYSPIMDVKEFPDVDVVIVEGAVANAKNAEILKEVRQKAKTLIAFGTCACLGGLPGLRNLNNAKDVLKRSYIESESTVDGEIPAEAPTLMPQVKPLSDYVKVDYQIPGCPPIPETIKQVLLDLALGNELVLPQRSLCHECSRKQTSMLIPKREFLSDSVVAVVELENIDPDMCFLEQGVLCIGPATREGCRARCLKGNMPCRGCMGPTPDAQEQGAKIINALSSVLPAGGLMFMEDMVGTGYRYSLPVSLLPTVIEKEETDE